MKTKKKTAEPTPQASHGEQPNPFTPGLTKGMVRQHAYELYRDKLKRDDQLTLEDWVLAEKDLVQTMQTDGVQR